MRQQHVSAWAHRGHLPAALLEAFLMMMHGNRLAMVPLYHQDNLHATLLELVLLMKTGLAPAPLQDLHQGPHLRMARDDTPVQISVVKVLRITPQHHRLPIHPGEVLQKIHGKVFLTMQRVLCLPLSASRKQIFLSKRGRLLTIKVPHC